MKVTIKTVARLIGKGTKIDLVLCPDKWFRMQVEWIFLNP